MQGRIKASAGPGAVPNAGPLQTYNQVTTPTNCGPPKLRARVLQHPSTPLNAALSKWELLGLFRLQLKTVTVQKITLITDNL